MSVLFGSRWPEASSSQNNFSNSFFSQSTQRQDLGASQNAKLDRSMNGGYFALASTSKPINALLDTIPHASADVLKSTAEQLPRDVTGIFHGGTEGACVTDTEKDEEEEIKKLRERRKQLEKEKEVANEGEFDWVRSGGVLRDARGRRDKLRTGKIKEEIRVQEREKMLAARWEIYEQKWTALVNSEDPVSFQDIPWPTNESPSSVEHLAFPAISEFLLDPLDIRTNTVTKRERIRTSLLRWHPDKISSVLGRVVPDDVRSVREGVGAVFVSLKRMKEQ